MKNERTVPIGQLDQSSPEFSNPRQDLVQAGLGSGAIILTGIIALVGLALGGMVTATFVLWYIYGLLAVAMTPIVALGYMSVRAFFGRHRLAHERVSAEIYRLRSELDLNEDGDTTKTEVLKFLKYVRHVYYGASTSSTEAERSLKMSYQTWMHYRDAMVAMGLAFKVGKGPGQGYELHERVKTAAWGDIEKRVRDSLLGRISLDITDNSTASLARNPRKIGPVTGGESGGVQEQMTTLD